MSVESASLELVGGDVFPKKVGRWHATLHLARRKPLGTLSLLFLLSLGFVAIFQGVIANHDPLSTNPLGRLEGPSAEHFFGTDELGRDVFSRMVYGTRTALLAGILATSVGVGLGTLIGLLSGYFGGLVDTVLQRLMDAVMAIPGLILLLSLVSVLEPSLFSIIIALSIFITPGTSRIVRGTVLATKELPYVESARALGATSSRIMFIHILPNILPTVIIVASVLVGASILIEASLSFLGLGVPPPHPTWGSMLSISARRYMQHQPWLAVWPGVALSLTVLASNLLGDMLRDVLDPRLRGSR
jgi:peptide/nickel transport system permease protein